MHLTAEVSKKPKFDDLLRESERLRQRSQELIAAIEQLRGSVAKMKHDLLPQPRKSRRPQK